MTNRVPSRDLLQPLSVPWSGLTDTSSTPSSWIRSMSPCRCA